MSTPLAGERTTLHTRPRERRQAHELLQEVDGHLETLIVEVASHQTQVPPQLTRVISQVIEVMAAGGTVLVSSLPDELTTVVAAEQLGVSRPTLMRMIRDGEIAAHKVGTHHRLLTADVLALKRARLERQREAFVEMRTLEDEIDEL